MRNWRNRNKVYSLVHNIVYLLVLISEPQLCNWLGGTEFSGLLLQLFHKSKVISK